MKKIDVSQTAQYWLRILGALALMKMATSLVKDAEKLISSTMKSRDPELADEIDNVRIVEYEDDDEDSQVVSEGEYSENGNGVSLHPVVEGGDEYASEN